MRIFSWISKKPKPPIPMMSGDEQSLWLYTILDLLPKPFFLLNLDEKRVTYTNAAARKILGADYSTNPASQAYLKLFWVYDTNGSLVPMENLPSARTLRGEKVDGEEFLLVGKNGEFNIKVYSQHIPKLPGQPATAIIIFQDITSLKQTENSLRRTQVDLNEAVEIADVGFWSVDVATQKTTLSPQLMKQFGLNESNYKGQLSDALAAIHPEDRERVSQEINKSITQGSHYQIEYRVVHPDGKIRWIEARSGAAGGKTDTQRFSGTTIDITEKHAAQSAIEESEKNLRLLADSMPQIVWSADAQGSLDYFNQVWFDYSGSTYEENQGSLWTRFVHPDDLPKTIENWKKSIASNELYENEFRLLNRKGIYRWHVARARPIFNNNGKVQKWYGTNTDIHDQKLLSDKLEEARATAERANTAKSQFLANMSHEIRTPLGAIMGFSELIKDNDLGRAEREGYIAVIERNSSQLMRIIDDILDLSKVEAGMMQIENIEFSLPEALTDFASLMGFKAREKGIQFTSKALTPLPLTIYCDPTRLRQILMNVVGNAIKFTDAGHVELRVSYLDGNLNFEVEDTGRGISPEQEANLFQPFTQADASTTRKYGGTGLGLVLTRSLSEALGGHFVLKQSAIGKGSLFEVRVKATVAEGAKFYSGMGFETPAPRSVARVGLLAELKILLVEDSPDNQELISIYLGRAGAHVDIASNGQQGVDMAMQSDYDIVLMDVQMPVMDGITAIKTLREKNYSRPVLALTAHAMKEERIRCLQAGFSDFLSKPINREDLINIILKNKS